MLTMRDCLDYCDLTDEEVDMLARHEHISGDIAAPFACSLVQTEEGVAFFSQSLSDVVAEAIEDGRPDDVGHALEIYAEFCAAHPLHHKG